MALKQKSGTAGDAREKIQFYGKANRPSTPVKGIIQNAQFHTDNAVRQEMVKVSNQIINSNSFQGAPNSKGGLKKPVMTKSAALAAQKAAEQRQSREMNVKSEVGFKLKQFTDVPAKVTTARRPSPGKTNQTMEV